MSWYGTIGDPLVQLIEKAGETIGAIATSIKDGMGGVLVAAGNIKDALLHGGEKNTTQISEPEIAPPKVEVAEATIAPPDMGKVIEGLGAGAAHIYADIKKLANFSPAHMGETGVVLANNDVPSPVLNVPGVVRGASQGLPVG